MTQLPFGPRRENPWTASNLRLAERRAKKASRAVDAWKLRQAAASAAGRSLKIAQPKSKTLLFKQLDHLCKLIVFRRDMKRFSGYCLVCVIKRELGLTKEPPRPITTPYHVLPRGDKAVRWDIRNVIGSCGGCNYGELKSRATSAGKARMRVIHSLIVSETVLLDLEALAKTTVHFSTADLIALRDKLKAQLESPGIWAKDDGSAKVRFGDFDMLKRSKKQEGNL